MLTAVNLYVFYFKKDTAVKNLREASTIRGGLAGKAERIDDDAEGTALRDKEAAETAVGAGAENDSRVVEGQIGNLDTLSTLLSREGFDAVALAVPAALAKLVDPRTVKPGETFALSFDQRGLPQSFEYKPSKALTFVVERQDDDTWLARKEERQLDLRVETVAGIIDSSLYGSIQAAGESPALVAHLVDLFAWDINFFTDTHPGDHWKVSIEKSFLDGEFYRYGRILAAEYGGRVGTFRAFHFTEAGQEGYFDDKGQAVAKSFLKTPLRFVRVSSKFDRNRFHPILHRNKAHLGVDYAAPIGTPVWAASAGTVTEAAMKRGSGNTLVIKHPNGYATRYYHLQKFARGIKAGVAVKQKQIVGYVGTTGLSTGPHLHFGVTMNGSFVDPMKLKIVREASVRARGAFLAAIAPRVAALDAAVAVAHTASAAPAAAGVSGDADDTASP